MCGEARGGSVTNVWGGKGFQEITNVWKSVTLRFLIVITSPHTVLSGRIQGKHSVCLPLPKPTDGKKSLPFILPAVARASIGLRFQLSWGGRLGHITLSPFYEDQPNAPTTKKNKRGNMSQLEKNL